MIQIHQDTEIKASAEEIFAAIVDLRGHDRWLTASSAFRGITDISSDSLALGTTWTEPGPTWASSSLRQQPGSMFAES